MRYWKGKKVNGTPIVGIGVAAYLDKPRTVASLQALSGSVLAQTWPHWQMLIVHDGPLAEMYQESVRPLIADVRISWWNTPERKQQFGHPHRQKQLEKLCESCDWVMLTNGDNYYCPVFMEWLLAIGTNTKRCDAVFCDMVHSHKMWKPLQSDFRRGRLDLGGFMVRAAIARQVKFDNFSFAGDGDFINRIRAVAKNIQRVPATLYVHN